MHSKILEMSFCFLSHSFVFVCSQFQGIHDTLMKTLTPFIRLTNKHKMFLLSIITLLLSSRTSYSFRLQPTSQRSGVTQSSILHRLSSHCPLPSPLFSLNDLIEDISSNDSRIVFVGGKGGVGKTSISSALAVELASSITHDRRVLVVSTDPAHSLGDALDVDLRSAEGDPVLLTDALTRGNLFACEIDPNKALESFQETLSAFETADAAKAELISFQMQMYGLDEIFSNEAQTELLIVAIPNQLAVRESIRLLNDFSFESTPTRLGILW